MRKIDLQAFLALAVAFLPLHFAEAANHSVSIEGFAFSPATVNIKQGDTVTWTNLDGANHTATADDSSWTSLSLGQGGTYSRTFNDLGTIGYHCARHTSMTAAVVVESAGPPSPTVAIITPVNNANYPAPTNVTIEATATAGGGSILRIEFLSGNNSIGIVTNLPYRVISPFPVGTHILTARATDSGGGSNTSAAITISVQGVGTTITNAFALPIAKSDLTIELSLVASGMASPLGLTYPDDGSGRLFVYDQFGYIHVIENGAKLSTPMLDVRARMVPLGAGYSERGLLGAAAHPNFASNPFIYTYTSEPNNGAADFPITITGGTNNHQSVIAEWQIDPSNPNLLNPASRREILRIDEPQSNHNGGAMHFGADGFLYVSLGDGGNADDQGNGHSAGGNGQDKNNILGKVIRINVDARTSTNGKYAVPQDNPFVNADGVDEIYAYGFRNPYTFSFDRVTGELYVADVGQNQVEELDRVFKGGNYGWPIKEGSFFFDPNGAAAGRITTAPVVSVPHDLIDPIAQYDHDDGLAIVGGYVYRGTKIPGLTGRYVTGDWGSFTNANGRLFFLDRGEFKEFRIGLNNRSAGFWLKGFGEDAEGELYAFGSTTAGPSGTTGLMYKIVPVPGDSFCGITKSDSQVNFSWTNAVGPLVVQSKSDLSDPLWQTVFATNQGAGRVFTTEAQQFFRLGDVAGNPAIPFTVHLTGDQERPTPANTTATGTGILSLEGNTLHFNVSYSGLSSAAISAHIHGPAKVSGFAGVLINLGSFNGGRWGTNGVLFGSLTLTVAQKAMLLNGELYINIHSGNFGGGEIRGQIAPVVFAASLNGLSERPTPVQSPATGSAIALLAGNQLTLQISYKNLQSTAIAAHIHGPASSSESAGVLVDLGPIHNGPFGTRGYFAGTVTLTSTQLGYLQENRLYINIHSSTSQGGEIRGQLLPRVLAVPFTTSLIGNSERPTPVVTSGTGTGNMFLEGNRLHFELGYNTLSTVAIAAHIHGFTNTTGAAGIQVDLGGFNNGAFGQLGAFSGQVTLTDTQRAHLVQGKTYVNVHTTSNGGGEIRGQVIPTLLQAPLLGASVRPVAVQSGATGSARLLLVDKRLHVNASSTLIGSSAMTATVSGPAQPNNVAAALVNFGSFPTSGGVFGSVLIDNTTSSALVDGLSYLSIQTTNRPAGEIRGQIVP